MDLSKQEKYGLEMVENVGDTGEDKSLISTQIASEISEEVTQDGSGKVIESLLSSSADGVEKQENGCHAKELCGEFEKQHSIEVSDKCAVTSLLSIQPTIETLKDVDETSRHSEQQDIERSKSLAMKIARVLLPTIGYSAVDPMEPSPVSNMRLITTFFVVLITYVSPVVILLVTLWIFNLQNTIEHPEGWLNCALWYAFV